MKGMKWYDKNLHGTCKGSTMCSKVYINEGDEEGIST